jgi:2-oxoisovalerate dehydrogenase E1 component
MPGGFGKDVGDPWHSMSNEVMYAHAVGWQVVMPSNAADAAGLLRAAMRSRNPTVFFEHRALLMTSDGAARWPGDDYVVPIGTAAVLREGTDVTLVTWGAMVHRCLEAVAPFGDRVEVIDLRTVAPWDRGTVTASVRKTKRAVIVHEDAITAGFGAEIAATLAQACFWDLDAPVERVAVEDIPMPYHPDLMAAVAPDVGRIAAAIERTLGA